MKWLLLLTLSLSCWAQTQGGVPRLHQSMPRGAGGSSGNNIILPDGVTAGQLIVTCSLNNNNSAITLSDTDSNTYTNLALFAVAAPNAYLQMSYAVAAHTVSSLTVTGTPGGSGSSFQPTGLSTVGVYDGLSGTTDGTGSATALASSGSVAASATTTTNGDGVIGCAAIDGSGGLQHGTPSPSAGIQYVAREDYNRSFQSFTVGGSAGSQTITDLIAGGTSTNFGMFVAAFKPSSTIAVATTALADCGNNLLCVQQLKGVGGTAAYTWSTTAGTWPTGCSNASLNSSTGVISCTPTQNGTFSLTFQITDGTNTATKALSLTVGATLATPVVRSQPINLNPVQNGGTITINIQCPSDRVLFLLHGSDTHGTHGWVPPIDGANNNITTSGVTPVVIRPIGGSGNAPLQAIIFGPFNNFGPRAFTFNDSTSSAVALAGWAIDIGGIQSVVDDGVAAGAVDSNSSGTYSISSSYTSLVANQFLMQFAADDQDGGINAPNDTIIFNPLTQIAAAQSNGGFDNTAVGTYSITSPSTVSTTTSITHPSSQENAGILQFALRPAITSASACAPTFAGEKIRRQIF